MQHILIIGAGAAGLMAGRILSEQGYRITFLEARDRTGGRIHTLHGGAFSRPIELGAEFVHGNLPLTLDLLREAAIPYTEIEGALWHYEDGRFHQDDSFTEHWPLLIGKLQALEADCSILAFLEQAFGDDQYAAMRASVIRFASGYDAADPADVSAFSLRDEWSSEEPGDDQYRIEGGYGRLMHYLQEQCIKHGAAFHLSAAVTALEWAGDHITATTGDGATYTADKVIVTLPPSLLQLETIRFTPAIPAYIQAAAQIGCGHVIKFILQFREAFWKTTNMARQDRLHMLLSNEEIPTWWTQRPATDALLTGWIGGPAAFRMSGLGKEALLTKALDTLSRILGEPVATLRQHLEDHAIADWTATPFTRCAYAYEKVETRAARMVLKTPVGHTLFFAGEALYDGAAKDTVEAALCSGQEAAEQIVATATPV